MDATEATDAAASARLREEMDAASKLEKDVSGLGLKIENLRVFIEGDQATISGGAAD